MLVHEAFRRRLLEPVYKAMPHLSKLAAYHADTPEVGRIAVEADVGTLVLTRLIPSPRNEKERQGFEDDVRGGGHEGTLIVADDLTTVRFGEP